eukprot:196220_1
METENKNDEYQPPSDVLVLQRSLVIGIILLIFAVTKLPLVTRQLSKWNVRENECNELCEFELCFKICDHTDRVLGAYAVMEVGLALIIVFTICTMAKPTIDWLECNKDCSILGGIFMTGLILGGLFYMMGYWIILDILVNINRSEIPTRYNFDDVWDWKLTVTFFEFYLGGITAIFYGIDCFFKILTEKQSGVFVFLSQLALVSLICFMGYVRIADFRYKFFPDSTMNWTFPLIASGYILILFMSFLYIAFYKIKVPNIAMNIIASLLIIGGILTAIGYWGEYNDPGDHTKNSWTTAYCFLLLTLCSFCAYYIWNSKEDNKVYDTVSRQDE